MSFCNGTGIVSNRDAVILALAERLVTRENEAFEMNERIFNLEFPNYHD